MTNLSLPLLCILVAGAVAEPAPVPGRVPKVYNALITSNQNLEPSKAYPVYQPVLHETAYGIPFQPAVFYGSDFPINNGLLPGPPPAPRDPTLKQSPPPPCPPDETPAEPQAPSTENPPPTPQATPETEGSQSTPAPPPSPNTQSPIPLNEFGLPAQVLPLGRIDPAYNGFTQLGPFTYTYPGLRFYDPYDPFSLNPYAGFTPYRPLTDVLGRSAIPFGPVGQPQAPAASAPTEQPAAGDTPPSEPSDLNLLNYSSKDPAIPNVPPPPLPQGGLKSDKSD